MRGHTAANPDLYADLERRQMVRSREVLAGRAPDTPEIRFRAALYTTHYGMQRHANSERDAHWYVRADAGRPPAGIWPSSGSG